MTSGDDQKIEYTVGDRLLIQQAVDGVGELKVMFKEYMAKQEEKEEKHDKVHKSIETRITIAQNRQQNVRRFFKITAGVVAAVGTLIGIAKALEALF